MDLSEIQRAALQTATRNGLAPLEAVAPQRLSAWAEAHFYLSAESSYVEGPWRAYPYQVAIMDAIGNDSIREVWWRKSARTGYTKIILAAIGYFAEHKRRNQVIWQPTDDDSDEFCKTELEPMLRDVAAMERVFPEFLAKNKANTLRQKQFLGCTLHLRGGKAAKNYRRLTVDVAILDELDGFDIDVEKEGSPVGLAAKRVEGATFPKIIGGSTPKLKHLSMIDARYDQAELRFTFEIPCPHCGHEHPLTWGGKAAPHGMKWRDRDTESIAQLCPACGALYTQGQYLAVWQRGVWRAQDGTWIDGEGRFRTPDGAARNAPTSISFRIWTAYSPQTSWQQIAREYFHAIDRVRAGDRSELKTFVNTTLGETYEEDSEKADENELKKRAEPYPLRTLPLGVLILAAGVDVQDNRFEVVVWGFGRREEMWVIDYMVLDANPADERDWEKLDLYLQSRFRHVSGNTLGIEAAAIDTGGHFTHQVYNFCRMRARRRILAIRGETVPGRPIKGKAGMQDVNWKGQVLKNGVRLWHVGTDTAKDLIYGRLKVMQPGPGYMHFSTELPDAFYTQLTAEVRVLQRTARGTVHVWVAKGRNEALDCTVYAIFCSHVLDLHRYTDRMWERLEQAVQPPTGDLFEQPAPPVEVQTSASPALPAKLMKSAQSISRRPSGFVGRW